MALTESKTMKVGTEAPAFKLPDTVSGETLQFADIAGAKGTVVLFICNHCPYVIHVNPELVRLANDYQKKGIGFVAISANDTERYPQDGPDRMKAHAEQLEYPFPYLYDETQDVAKAYDAVCTPDIYLFDSENRLFYHGRLDGARPKNDVPLTGTDLRDAIDRLLTGKPAPEKQYPSAGCSIKWK